MRWLFLIFIFVSFSIISQAQAPDKVFSKSSILNSEKNNLYNRADSLWADSVFNKLTPTQRLAQLFMVAVNPMEPTDVERVRNMVSKIGIGGLIFFKGHPYQVAEQINLMQQSAHIPLLIGIDGEWGLAMRLDTVIDYPKQMMLGAIQNDSLIYQMGLDIGAQCKRLGIHIDFAPVADININPANPIINYRSFGEDRTNVSRKAIAYMQGLQDAGVIACAKHFPGHGDVNMDSHLTLPNISASAQRLDSIELYPFRQLIAHGCRSIMVAHLNVPALTGKTIPTTLSKQVVTDLLTNKYGFKGLIFTDALNMKGVANSYPPGVVDVKALEAGNDVLLYSMNVEKALDEIENAIQNRELAQADVDHHIKKILMAKSQNGLNHKPENNLDNLHFDINTKTYKKNLQTLVSSSITIVKNHNGIVPIKKQMLPSTAILSIDDGMITSFQNDVRLYETCRNFILPTKATMAQLRSMSIKLLRYKTIVIGLHQVNTNLLGAYYISPAIVAFVNQLIKTHNVILIDFGTPYALKYFSNVQSIICAYNNETYTQMCAARVITGQASATGRLPVSASPELSVNTGIDFIAKPYVFNLKAAIDSVCINGINEEAFPGCRILAYYKDSVLFNKSYGHFTYNENAAKVDDSTLYDLASITKTASTTLAVMRLYEEGKIELQKTIGDYLHGWDSTNKKNITISQLLTHTGGMRAWLPFYVPTLMQNHLPDTLLYISHADSNHTIPVTPTLFLKKGYTDSMWKMIKLSPIGAPGRFLYSDLDFILLQKIIETVTNQSLSTYVNNTFYMPMHLHNIMFNPLNKIDIKRIPPTADDHSFRHQIVDGTVHDPAAAMMGGVAGHAGLFSTADDLAKLFIMLSDSGRYKGVRYFKPETVTLFTNRYLPNVNRGLGFDKPGNHTGASDFAPICTFGHTGFTGTCVWADPENKLVFVFLSNRTFPQEDNWKIVQMGIRNAVHDALYIEINKDKTH